MSVRTSRLRILGFSCVAGCAIFCVTAAGMALFRLATTGIERLKSLREVDWEGMPIEVVIPLAVLLAPVIEELLFRRCLLRLLMKWLPTSASIGLSAIAFAGWHYDSYEIYHAGMFPFVLFFISGLAFGTIYVHSRRLMAPIAVHALHNALAFYCPSYSLLATALPFYANLTLAVCAILLGLSCFLKASRATKPNRVTSP